MRSFFEKLSKSRLIPVMLVAILFAQTLASVLSPWLPQQIFGGGYFNS